MLEHHTKGFDPSRPRDSEGHFLAKELPAILEDGTLSPSRDLAWTLGVLCSGGNVDTKRCTVTTSSVDPAFASTFLSRASGTFCYPGKVRQVVNTKTNRASYVVEFHNKILSETIGELPEASWPSSMIMRHPWVFESEQFLWGFLEGVFDRKGSVGNDGKYGEILFRSSSEDVKECIEGILLLLGVDITKRGGEENIDKRGVGIYRHDLVHFLAKNIHSSVPAKETVLDSLRGNTTAQEELDSKAVSNPKSSSREDDQEKKLLSKEEEISLSEGILGRRIQIEEMLRNRAGVQKRGLPTMLIDKRIFELKTQLNDQVTILIESNMGLVVSIAKTLVFDDSAWDDMKQVGQIALMRAALKFDGSRGNRFVSLAYRSVRNAMLSELRRANACYKIVEAVTPNIELTNQHNELPSHIVSVAFQEVALSTLSEQEFQILYARVGMGYTRSEIAAQLETEPDKVAKIEAQALKKLRDESVIEKLSTLL